MFIFVNCFFKREHTASVAGLPSWTVTVHGGLVGSGSGVGVVSGERAWRARRVEMIVEQVDSRRVRYEVEEVAICKEQVVASADVAIMAKYGIGHVRGW